MGGFTLTGPKYLFQSTCEKTDLMCKCMGMQTSISKEQELQLLGHNGKITKDDFYLIIPDNGQHVFVGDNNSIKYNVILKKHDRIPSHIMYPS